MARFELSFTGLCAFSPDTTFKTVALVRAHSLSGHSHDLSHLHVGALLAPFESVVTLEDDPSDSSVRDFDFVFERDRDVYGAPVMAAFLLNGEQLTLDSLQGTFSLVPDTGDPNALCPRQDYDDPGDSLWAFRWIADMPQAEAASWDPAAPSDRVKVLAHLKLDAGKLGTALFNGEDETVYHWRHQVDPNDNPGGDGRAIAEVVRLASSFQGNTIRIRSNQRPNIVLRGNSVSAWLVNLPLVDMLGDQDVVLKDHPHFKNYYKVSDKPNGSRFPHRKHVCRDVKRSPRAPTNPKCPPVGFAS